MRSLSKIDEKEISDKIRLWTAACFLSGLPGTFILFYIVAWILKLIMK